MRRFLVRLVVFSLPVVIGMAGILSIGWYVGAVQPFETIAGLQAEDPSVRYVFRITRQRLLDYKYQSVLVHRPQLLILGSSRALAFRGGFATRCPAALYNAAMPAMPIDEVAPFFEDVLARGVRPDVVLLTLDYPDYNLESDFRRTRRLRAGDAPLRRQVLQNLGHFVFEVALDPQGVRNLPAFDPQAGRYGWQFLLAANPDHYVGDGARVLSDLGEERRAYELARHEYALENRLSFYAPGAEVDMDAVQQVDDLLARAAEHDVTVIGVFLPYHSAFYARIFDEPAYGYIPGTQREIEAVFGAYSFPLYDFSDPTTVDVGDSGFYDGWHMGELNSLKLFAAVVRAEPELLARYADIATLQDEIATADAPFYLQLGATATSSVGGCG